MHDEKEYIRIFIGSPSDVDIERDIAYKVILDVEEILNIFKDHLLGISIAPLRAIGWEQVSPGVGLPNRIILERFPVEESDIFIFILWKRFGTPPGTCKENGKKYSSGTEQEFDTAFLNKCPKQDGVSIYYGVSKKG